MEHKICTQTMILQGFYLRRLARVGYYKHIVKLLTLTNRVEEVVIIQGSKDPTPVPGVDMAA